ncbi:MAG TPA: LysR family transcriptional regulator [Burkholderiales bacterium]|nr:LysR family transcriptional regulator [Burkholderiales bacterium]
MHPPVNFSLPELRAFIEVVRSGSLSGATTKLNLSQPALSRRIDMIEQALGATLLDRHHDGTRLTAAGRAFLPHAEAALAELRDGIESVHGAARGESGDVRVAMVASLCNRAVLGELERFRAESPDIRLRLHTTTSADVSELVRSGEASFGIRYRGDPDRRLQSASIGQETMMVVCSPRHALARLETVSVARLAEETWIVWPLHPGEPDGGFIRVLASYGLKGNSTMITDSTILQKQLIESGFGIGLMAATSIREDVAAGTLCTLRVPAMRGGLSVVAVTRKGAHISSAARKLMDRLVPAYAPQRTSPSRRSRA